MILIHIFHVLIWGYHHIHGSHHLLRFYLHHHAIRFLRSGMTSETPHSRRAALSLLKWLVSRHISPVDW